MEADHKNLGTKAGKQNSVTDKCSAKNVTEVKEGNKDKYILLEYKDIMTMVEN